MSARSTQILFHNETAFTLSKVSDDLPHGEWGQQPPNTIAPHSVGTIDSESNGFLTGTEGRVTYQLDDGKASQVFFHWDNPYSGTNKYNQSTSADFFVFHSGGSGDNTSVDVFLRSSERRFAGNFRPSTHGFRFPNHWGDTPYSLPPLKGSILDFKYGNAQNGLCGGMIYTSRDYFESGWPIPALPAPPAGEQNPLFVYFVNRLFDSFDLNDVTLYLKLMDPLYPDTDENILNPVGLADGRAFVMANIEWPLIRQDIDAGHPSPMGLVAVKSLLPTDLGKNHQVLAYSYEVHADDVTLWVYDPNQPLRDDITLQFSTRSTADRIEVRHNVDIGDDNGGRRPIYCFFRTNYELREPPHLFTAPGSPSSAVARLNNHIDVFWIGQDGAIASNWWDANVNNANWNVPFPISGPNAAQSTAITTLARVPEHIDVFWIWSDGGVGSDWWDASANNTRWNAPFGIAPPGSAQPGAIAAASRRVDHLDVFWIGQDGAVASNWWDANAHNAQWNAPFSITPPNAAGQGGLAATARTRDHIDVFWIGLDGAVGSNWWDVNVNNAQWNVPFPISPPGAAHQKSAVNCTARTPEHLDVFWIGPDGAIMSNWWDAKVNNARWNVPFAISGPNNAHLLCGIACVARVPEHLDVFWVGNDGAVWSAWWDANANNALWNAPFEIAPVGAAHPCSPVSAVSRLPEHIDVFWIGPDGAIGSNWWNFNVNNARWNTPFPISPPNAARIPSEEHR